MIPGMRTFSLTAMLLLASSGLAQSIIDKAIDTNVGDHVKVQQLITDLQQAVAKHDPTAVAALISYPITINPGTKSAVVIRTPQAFTRPLRLNHHACHRHRHRKTEVHRPLHQLSGSHVRQWRSLDLPHLQRQSLQTIRHQDQHHPIH